MRHTFRGVLGGLGAVTGERLEYWVPGSVMESLGLARAMAVCFPNTDEFIRALMYTAAKEGARLKTAVRIQEGQFSDRMKTKYARSMKLAQGKAEAILPLIEQVKGEVGFLRANGVEGSIPVCVYRATGKKGGKERFERRSTAMHERFHARVRRFEAEKGVQERSLGPRMLKLMEADFGDLGTQAIALARIQKWAQSDRTLAEEILARVEELRQSCVRSKDDCASIKAQFHRIEQSVSGKYRVSGQVAVFDRTMERLTDEVVKRYGGAMAFVGAAYRGLLEQKP